VRDPRLQDKSGSGTVPEVRGDGGRSVGREAARGTRDGKFGGCK
jgi:hypothetical protein